MPDDVGPHKILEREIGFFEMIPLEYIWNFDL
jgi:hypothetical protein